MCLSNIDTVEVRDKIKTTIPEEGIIVYKVVYIGTLFSTNLKKYYPVYSHITVSYCKGLNKAKTNTTVYTGNGPLYKAGFHFWVTEKIAKEHLRYMHDGTAKVIKCIVKKEWITETGKQKLHDIEARVIVAKKAIFPAFSRKE